jgi:hypothetical protein
MTYPSRNSTNLEGENLLSKAIDSLEKAMERAGVIRLAIGLFSAYLVGRAMHSILFRIGAISSRALGLGASLLFLAALLAWIIPAGRAASVNRMQT